MLKSVLACWALVATAVLVPSSALAAPAPVAGAEPSARATTCDRNTYVTKVRSVTGLRSIGISRMWVHTYPGKTVLHEGSTVTTNFRVTLKAGVSTTVGATFSAGTMLRKVVKLYGEVSGSTTYQASLGSTYSESKTVVQDSTVTIPGGRTVVWFVGHKKVKGAFEYSSCDYSAEEPKDTGHVTWHSSRWSSYAIRDDGGQRCDLDANTSVARAAKRIGCS